MTFSLEDCSEFGNFVITLIDNTKTNEKVLELMETYNVTDPFRGLYLELKRFAEEKRVLELMDRRMHL